jgi:hypothetical protein
MAGGDVYAVRCGIVTKQMYECHICMFVVPTSFCKTCRVKATMTNSEKIVWLRTWTRDLPPDSLFIRLNAHRPVAMGGRNVTLRLDVVVKRKLRGLRKNFICEKNITRNNMNLSYPLISSAFDSSFHT